MQYQQEFYLVCITRLSRHAVSAILSIASYGKNDIISEEEYIAESKTAKTMEKKRVRVWSDRYSVHGTLSHGLPRLFRSPFLFRPRGSADFYGRCFTNRCSDPCVLEHDSIAQCFRSDVRLAFFYHAEDHDGSARWTNHVDPGFYRRRHF